MANTFTKVTREGFLNRGCSSIGGMIFGVIAFIAVCPLLFWNEGRAVRTYQMLQEGAGAVQSISAEQVDSTYQNKLVHLSGQATTDETLNDPLFGVSTQAIKLEREVEMYQWEEDKRTEREKNVGGSTTNRTTYTYNKVWSSRVINSSNFEEQNAHQNPNSIPYESETFVAGLVTVGAFNLSNSLVAEIDNKTALPVTDVPPELGIDAQVANGGYYLGQNPQSPQVGDVRITFNQVKPSQVSLIAKQVNNTFEPYKTEAGGSIEMLVVGQQSAASMFEDAEASNAVLTWILRAVGFFMAFVGIATVFKPLSVIADVIPFFGNIVSTGTGCAAGALAAPYALIIIAMGWIFYRPLLAIGLIILGLLPFAAAIGYGYWSSQQEAVA